MFDDTKLRKPSEKARGRESDSPEGTNNNKNNSVMKRIEFVSVWQLLVVSAFTLSAIVCFIGMFFNPIHVLTFSASAIMAIASYKEKSW